MARATGDVHEPRPVMPRPREPVIAPRGDPAQADRPNSCWPTSTRAATCRACDRGDIKKLLVLESLPKQVNFSGGQDLVSWCGTFTLERVLGTVPVEEDGSAYFEVPAGRPLFFVALDEQDLSVKRMHSFTQRDAGRNAGLRGLPRAAHRRRPHRGGRPTWRPCAGRPAASSPSPASPTCSISPATSSRSSTATASSATTTAGAKASVLPGGRSGPEWSHSYFSLFARRQVADGRNGLGNQPPRTHRQLRQPAAEDVRRQPLRREGHAARVADAFGCGSKAAHPMRAVMPACAITEQQKIASAATWPGLSGGARGAQGALQPMPCDR